MLPQAPRSSRLILWQRAATVIAVALLSACSQVPANPDANPDAAPEAGSGWSEKPGWATQDFAVASGHPLATQAGYDMLRAGGTALDAAIAVQMVLTLVEPQSSGIGGGAFLLHAHGTNVQAYDGRETAPAAVDENLFLQADGKPLAFNDAMASGRSVGVPGAVRMLEQAHRVHGKLPWARLFQPAIDLAENGFPVSHRLHTLLGNDKLLARDPVARAYFYDTAGKPWPVDHLLKNPELAQVLRGIAAQGSRGLLEGPTAQAIVDAVRTHPGAPGTLSLADLAGYQPRERAALCHDYQVQIPASQHSYRLCGFPPPSSGAIAIGQILGMLKQTPANGLPLGEDGLPGAEWLHYYSEAARLAYADRALYLADPDFVQPPAGSWHSLLAPAYLTQRAQLIGPRHMAKAAAGTPSPRPERVSFAPMAHQPEYGTSHISIVDANGNALALTTTIEAQFGARRMVNTSQGSAQPRSGGFLLNNQLTDFSFSPRGANGAPVANRVQAGKRPRSSMSPTLVFDNATGQLLASAGSPGGAQIIHYTGKALYAMLHWGLMPQQAIDLPNFGNISGPTQLEQERFPAATVQALQARGGEVQQIEMTSGLQVIVRGSAHGQPLWFSGSDARREGIVMGD
ncbi:gamma-glutamyltransferase family protein [Acidovorax sp. CCYZU-2555]|uniref:gamma-glutamyltransferase family protein n=1 Tax=Acidovorax sp. CCYZU-2555 TaxID=2835042 RepID=UPI001BCEBF30|nr:gamma-glutamyltransferase family protein [Acidovorax sp. CCYZU-2555]MBS7781601.1 gamma-glutamyltransferase family protein [Acidovorax sp. CCYZU-2555]